MIDTWPTTLPERFSRNFDSVDVDTLIRSEMDYGPQKVRKRFTGTLENVSTSLNLTEEQVTILKTFYRTTLAGGSRPFNHKYPIGDTIVKYKFMGPPQFTHVGGLAWTATLKLEITL